MRVWPGKPHPLGALWDGHGTNFALFSEHATAVQLQLFDAHTESEPATRVALTECTDAVWHAYLPEVRPGQLYGYRVEGPYAPELGHRFNPAKLLVDPCARAIVGPLRWNDAVFGYRVGDPREDLSLDPRDSAGFVPKGVVIDPSFPWGDDRPPATPWSPTLLYECHVKGLTARHPGVPEARRGRYLGLASEPILAHLSRLGVTAVKLMPVHHAITEPALHARGQTNYWGYNTLGFFAPDARFAGGSHGEQVSEFKTMVQALHRASIEVILDVVYNHTAEGDRLGPTLSLRGIDNRAYYRLVPRRPRDYEDFSGCGNGLRLEHPRTLQLVLDSLRYWVQEMHVDGFRFDLAPSLARENGVVNHSGRFFAMVRQDPLLAGVKLIAEPWDLGPDGQQLGRFPSSWAEWNPKYRDTVRRYWRGDAGQLGDLASRLSGSSDIFGPGGRGPDASINMVTSHDGFTLRDLVSYARKHNLPNAENERDGTDENWSRNWGREGPTEDVRIQRLRDRMARNFLATLAFSQGVPMLSHGDELGRSQLGNNNPYCLDGPVTWIDWELGPRERELLDFTRRVFALRLANPALRRRTFFSGRLEAGAGRKDVTWLGGDGLEMKTADWNDPERRVLGMWVVGETSEETDEQGGPLRGKSYLLLVNGSDRSCAFRLPELTSAGLWEQTLCTAQPGTPMLRGPTVALADRSLMLLTARDKA